MQINLTDLLSGNRESVTEHVSCEMEEIVLHEGTFSILEKQDFDVVIRRLGEQKVLVLAQTDMKIDIPCDRCLESVPTDFHLEVERDFEVRPEEDRDNPELSYDTEFIFGYNLDVDGLIYNEILLNWPMKTLCMDSCKGLCRKCGLNLNHGSCDCDTVSLDPRMAAILDIFKIDDEEV